MSGLREQDKKKTRAKTAAALFLFEGKTPIENLSKTQLPTLGETILHYQERNFLGHFIVNYFRFNLSALKRKYISPSFNILIFFLGGGGVDCNYE